MPYDPCRHVGRLPRLAPNNYVGVRSIHWSMTLEDRATGWLDDLHHARVREWLVHASARCQLLCPVYCLMPDHGHFLWTGWAAESNQKLAAKLFRETWNRELKNSRRCLQEQAHDHMLRGNETQRDAFTTIATYILDNPVRAGLVSNCCDYPFSGAVLPGYPRMDPREENFWDKFWRIFALLSGGVSEI